MMCGGTRLLCYLLILMKELSPCSGLILLIKRNLTKIWTTKGEELEAAKKGFFECLKLLEGELGEKPYFGGETLGYVDIAFLPFCCGFSTYETIGNFSIEAQLMSQDHCMG
ncbi:hypothetical protein POPTR_011G140501v4 [Populus trichocarpa]|uniref:Uncharacterized protein n=1 Tax=Populus trichocarpa TaxID=3694 RepID=A0ACC0S921_POPTR|nr:hypothetical protein POPTR_011G140501v4 [Populus trichocarpa]